MRRQHVNAQFFSLALLVGAVLGTAGIVDAACGGGPCSCGDTVDSNTVLSAATDPVCFTGSADTACPGTGLIVDPGIELDLGGCTIRGAAGSTDGIVADAGATVRNGRVIDFGELGVSLSGDDGRLANLLVTGSGTFGGVSAQGNGNALHSVVVRGGFTCIDVFGDGNTVLRGQVSDCFRGISVRGNSNTVERSIARATEGTAILSVGNGNTFAANRVEDSGGDGLRVTLGVGAVLTRNVVEGSAGCGIATGPLIANVIADTNRSQANTNGFCVTGTGHTFSRNVASANDIDGFQVDGSGSTFDLNRSMNNGAFGIFDFTTGGGTGGTGNTYTNNVCSGNDSGDSSPPGLCF